MGIIIRQSLKSSIINFLGVLIGFLSTIFIYPLHLEAYGFASNLYMISSFIAAFASMGVGSASVKYFNIYKNVNEKYPNGLLAFLILCVCISYLIISFIFLVFSNSILNVLDALNFKVEVLTSNVMATIILTILISLITLFSAYASNVGRITIPSFFNNFCYKVYLPVLIILVYWDYLQQSDVPKLLVVFFVAVLFLLIIYVYKLGIIQFQNIKISTYLKQKKPILKFIVVSNLTAIGSLLTFKIDTIMISGFLGYAAAGTYGLPLVMANVLDVPNQAISSITAPIIAKHWKNNEFNELNTIYKKASLNLLMAGLIILLIGYFSFDNLGQLSSNPDAFKNGKIIFLVIGLAKLVDLATSVNGSLISYSANYKYNLYFIAVLAGLNIYLNILFIPKYGLPGAAYATFISIFIFNSLKVIFLQYKYKIHPFSKDMIVILALSAFLVLILSWLNLSMHPIINISLTGLIVLTTFGFLIYKSNISPEGKSLLIKLRGYLSF